MSILKFKTEEEVIARANKSVYGLAAGICSRDVARCVRVAAQLNSGTICAVGRAPPRRGWPGTDAEIQGSTRTTRSTRRSPSGACFCTCTRAGAREATRLTRDPSGFKESGKGRELGTAGLDNFLELKTVVVPFL